MADNGDAGSNGRLPPLLPLLMLLILLASLTFGWLLLGLAQSRGDGESPPWVVVLLAAIGGMALWLGLHRPSSGWEWSARWQGVWRWLQAGGRYGRILAIVLSLGLTGYLLWRLPLWPADQSYRPLVGVWLAAFGLFMLGAAGWPGVVFDMDSWWRRNGRVAVGVLVLGLGALWLRGWQLGTLPFTLNGDEASQGLEAVRVLSGALRNPFSTGWLGVPTMSFFLNSVTIQLMGQTVVGLRLPWVLVGTATVILAFLLVQRLQGTRMAVVTAVLLAFYHYHIHYSRLGSNQIADPFFLTLALWLLYQGLDEKRPWAWGMTGGVTGLAFYFYAGARLTPVVLLAVLAYQVLRAPRQFWHNHIRGVLVMVSAFFVAAAPMLQYAVRFPNEFNARLNQVGIFQSGWMDLAMEVRQQGMVPILFDQFQRAFLAFNYYPDRTVWYGLQQPLLDPFFGVLFLLGLGYGTARLLGKQADVRLAPMVAWWWGGMLLGGMLTESPPSSQRLITLAVPTMFFLGLALMEAGVLLQRTLGLAWSRPFLGVAVMAFAIISLNTYFLEYTPSRRYGGANAEMATTIAPILREEKDTHRIIFTGAPWMYWGFATLPYLVPNADAVDVEIPMTTDMALGLLPDEKGALFVFVPQRQDEVQAVMSAVPDGERRDIFSPVDQRLLAILYRVERP